MIHEEGASFILKKFSDISISDGTSMKVWGIWQTNLIAVGLTLDVFAYCLYKGAMVSEIRKKELLKMVLLFTAFQTGMLVIGNAFTWIPAIHSSFAHAGRIWKLVAVVVFFCLGVMMILKSLKPRKIEEQKEDTYNYHVIAVWALITSIDALLAGIGFGFLGLKLIGAAVIVTIITAAGAFVGFICGYRLGCGPMNRFVTVGGCLVLIGGVDLLLDYLAVI